MKKILVLFAFLFSVFSTSEALAISYLDEIERAKDIRFESDEIIIEEIDLGKATLGTNDFAVRITNKTKQEKRYLIYLHGMSGLGAILDTDMTPAIVQAGKTLTVSTIYKFRALSPFAKLFVEFHEAGSEGVLFKSRFHLGAENPAQEFDLSKFGTLSSQHINLYFLPGTLAAERAGDILAERENGLIDIAAMAGIDFEGKIDFYLYPDMATKTADTMHIGEGWGFNRIMVEVYNEEVQLDPFHEASHVVTGTLGEPPALFDEGFALYATETQGVDALQYLGAPGRKVDDVARDYKAAGRLFPLAEMIAVTNIGSTPVRGEVEYPEAASFVKFLIERFGVAVFREIFSTLKSGDDPATVAANIKALEAITGLDLATLETQWLESL